MNDPLDATPPVPQPTPPEGAGAILRSAREAHKLPIGQLAERLKVSQRKLEALEADRYDILTDPVFTRALAASVCRALAIEAEPVLARLPQPRPHLIHVDDAGLNTAFREAGSGLGRTGFMHDRTSIGIAVLLLLAATLTLLIWPRRASDEHAQTSQGAPAQSGLLLAASAPAAVQTPATAPAKTPAPMPAPQSAPATLSAPAPATPGTAAPAQSVQPVQPVAAAAGAAPLTLKASGTSWVQVTDAKGVVQLHKTLQAGEEVSVAGELPLAVVLGRADLVSVTVRSKPFDLSPVTQSNVARFEVKQ